MTPREFARWFRPTFKDNPVKFSRTFLAKDPTTHKGQQNWLRRANQPINTLIPGNRFGKSVVTAMRHIHHNVFKVGVPDADVRGADYNTISVSVSADQAEIVFNEAKRLLDTPRARPLVKKIYSTPFPRIVFYNGAQMHCRSAHDDGKYIDGHAFRLVSIDEAGWLKNDLKKLMNGVIVMRLAGGGMIDLVGTPKGMTDLFWYANRGLRGVPGYYTQRGSIYDNPFLSPEDLAIRDKLLAESDPRLREQVLYGAFVSEAGMAFTADQLDQVFARMPAHRDPIVGHKYVQAWDLGRRTDFTVGVTFDVTSEPYEMVDFVRLNKVPWEHIYNLIGARAKEYWVHMPVIDATGMGGDVIEEELTKRGIFVDAQRTSSLQQKTELINTLQSALDYGRRTIGVRKVLDEAGFLREVPDMEPVGGNWGLFRMPPIPQLLDEFGGYELQDKDLVQDCVMAVAMAIHSVYDGSVLDAPTEGSIYGGGSAPMAICAGCQKGPLLVSQMSEWFDPHEGTVRLCVMCATERSVLTPQG